MALRLDSFPEELLSIILSFSDRSSLCAISRSSSRFHRLTVPHLYRHIILRIDRTGKLKHLALLATLALSRPDFVSYVSSISIEPIRGFRFGGKWSRKDEETLRHRSDNADEIPYTGESSERTAIPLMEITAAVELASKGESTNNQPCLAAIQQFSDAQVLPLVLKRMKGIRQLEISALYEPTHFLEPLLDAWGGRGQPAGSVLFSNLSDVTIRQSYWVGSFAEVFAVFFLLPSMKRIRGIQIKCQRSSKVPKLKPNTTSIEEIELDDCSFGSRGHTVIDFIQACKQLKHFSFRTLCTPVNSDSSPFRRLEPALKHHSAWLESLCFDDERSGDRFNGIQEPRNYAITNLSEFGALKHLEIPWPSLLDGSGLSYVHSDPPESQRVEQEASFIKYLVETLPSKLETLHISRLGDMLLSSGLERVLQKKHEYLPHMRHLTLWDAYSMLPTSERLRSLVKIAKDVGIGVDIC